MRIHSVQLLRAVAALLVLVGHAIAAGARMGHAERLPLPTGVGVDLFFAISGFIMVFASDRLFAKPGAGREFLARRIARVVPLYWLTTTAMLMLILLGSRAAPNPSYILSSYLFIPDLSYGSVDGVAFPLLSLGWTLNYEMLFYAIFSVFIMLPRRRASGWVIGVLLLGVTLGRVFQPQSTVLSTWSQPIILEFALGLLIGNALLDGTRLSRLVSAILILAACLWIIADPLHVADSLQTPNDFRRLVGWGMPAAALLAAVVLGPRELPLWCQRPAALLGDASYSLYLTHPFIMIVCERAWHHAIGPRYLTGFVVTVIVLAIALSVVVNKIVERPLTGVLQRRRTPVRQSVALSI
jgi:peptidoglycan/LPS O-acetylase OafA/YrhL